MRNALILLCLVPVLSFASGPAFAGEGPLLVGVARSPSDALDSKKETLGGVGSGMMLVPGSWHHTAKGFVADLDLLPDRGWNTAGTMDYQGRLQIFKLTLAPDEGAPGHEGQLSHLLGRHCRLISFDFIADSLFFCRTHGCSHLSSLLAISLSFLRC